MAPPLPLPRRKIVICGNGASAAALVYALARTVSEQTSVCVVGDGSAFGEGIAYGTKNPSHLLNIPAARMSLDPDDPDQFLRWLQAKGLSTDSWPEQFVPRHIYGRYLRDTVGGAIGSSANLRLEIEQAEVIGLVKREQGWTVSFKTGAVNADLVVLATGNDMPTPIRRRYGLDVASSIIDNPWNPLTTTRGEDILVLGTALTAVDTALTLLDRGHRGKITLMSRRAWLPHTHVQPAPFAPLEKPFPQTAHGILRAMRQAVGRSAKPEIWQGFMDAMRPVWPEIWRELSVQERQRFVRHGAAAWNVHRHRLAPAIGDRINAALRDGIEKLRGRIASITRRADGGMAVSILGHDGPRTIDVDRIVNCSGPNADPEKTYDRLIENIIASRYARASAAGIGLDVDEKDRVINRDGEAQRSLYAIGSLTRGRWWEITAIPEIARQAGTLAQTLVEQLKITNTQPGEEHNSTSSAAF